ncbi:MAG: DedA family protein, partial [Candidatus Sumerlaeota bacterium]|nr:DedA family protein [Candidatus Sumerlaeota bacterium]
MSRIPVWLFMPLNVIGAAVWAVAFGYGGYFFGAAILLVIKDVKRHQIQVLAGVCIAALALWVIRLLRAWRSARRAASPNG